MGSLLQVLILILIGTALLWFGYTLFFALGPRPRPGSQAGGSGFGRGSKADPGSFPGAARTCPVCSSKLPQGERVKSSAFPSMGGTDRLMHIAGCPYCLSGERSRACPVCGADLRTDQFLIARLFDKPGRSHVHVLGCVLCRGPQAKR